MGWFDDLARSVGNFVTRAAEAVKEAVVVAVEVVQEVAVTAVQLVANLFHPPPPSITYAPETEDEHRKTEEEAEEDSWLTDVLFWLGMGAIAAVAAPPVIVGILHLIGFGVGGIAAGSIGATMMSWGAGITPWYVSIFQSIGATGMIAGATQFSIGSMVTSLGLIWNRWRRAILN